MFIKDIPADIFLFIMLYGGTSIACLIACLYLCLRKGNAFSSDVTPPVRPRRWAAALFAIGFLGHLWWFFFYIYSVPVFSVGHIGLALLDSVTMLITISGTLLSMLQDRRRPVWPIVVATIPLVVFGGLHVVNPDGHFLSVSIAYFIFIYLIFTIYMVFAIRQYRRWLSSNYADLENKEVWLSHSLIIIFLLLIILYGFDGYSITISFIMQAIEIPLFAMLLWRIETLPQLESSSDPENPAPLDIPFTPSPSDHSEYSDSADSSDHSDPIRYPVDPLSRNPENAHDPSDYSDTHSADTADSSIFSNIEQLLETRCIATQLYLQHDLSLSQLSRVIGTNHSYLSQYFSQQGINYSTYINNLRIDHFVRLYRQAVADGNPFTAQQLATQSGYRSYSTFSTAFKQRMNQTVTAWMSAPTQ